MLRRTEMKAKSLEKTVEQKNKENEVNPDLLGIGYKSPV